MSRRKSDDGFFESVFEVLVLVPAWVGPFLAIAAYLALRFGWPAIFSGDDPGKPMLAGIGPAIAPWGAMAFLGTWAAAEFHKWRRRKLLDAQSGLDSIRDLSWQEFEHLVGEAYRRQGYMAEETGSSGGDGGVDLALNGNGQRVLVQCKQWKQRSVGVKTVRELYGVLVSEHADRAILITVGRYTPDAREFANGKPLELVEGAELETMIRAVRKRDGSAVSAELPEQPAAPAIQSPGETAATVAGSPCCPKCGAEMTLREARKGANAGSKFWGCPTYPRCRGTREV